MARVHCPILHRPGPDKVDQRKPPSKIMALLSRPGAKNVVLPRKTSPRRLGPPQATALDSPPWSMILLVQPRDQTRLKRIQVLLLRKRSQIHSRGSPCRVRSQKRRRMTFHQSDPSGT